jgi:hypothetical protein
MVYINVIQGILPAGFVNALEKKRRFIPPQQIPDRAILHI